MVDGRGEYRLGYRGDIEGLRAIAILLVIGAHAGVPWLGGGFVGVDVFFVLSGFLITGLLVQEITGTGRLNFADFYIRRLRRLLPALILMLVGSAFVASLLLAPSEQISQASAGASAAAWWSNIHFALGRLDYFSAGTETNIFLHTWSLGVEEQFYLVWPALVFLLIRNSPRDAGMTRLRISMGIVIAASLVTCVIATYREPQFAFYMMPLRAWQFAMGALVSLHFSSWSSVDNASQGSNNPELPSVFAGWIGLIMLIGAGVYLSANQAYPGLYALVPTIGATCIIASGGRTGTAGVSALLSLAPFQVIGRISYAWYLWHWPVLLLGHALTGSNEPLYRATYVVVSLVLAVGSYYFVEAPIRHQRWWLTHQRAAIYGALALMVLGTFGFVSWNGKAYREAQSPGQLQFAEAHADAPIIYGMGCDDWYHSDQVKLCSFGPEKAAHTAVLIGDSVTAQWFPAFAKAFEQGDWRLVVLTKSSCPMVDEPFFYVRIGRAYTECSVWRRNALEQVAALRPDVVLLGSTATNGFTQEEWTDGTVKVLDVISKSVGHIYLLRGTPHLSFDGPSCLAEQHVRPSWLQARQACSSPIQDKQADLVYRWLQDAAGRFSNATTLDMNDAVCPQGLCVAQQHGIIVFRDSQHITATFALSLGDLLRKRLGAGVFQ
jgi:peptidoglycan/LPS O-acetylase OafA/YrhL